MFASLLPVPQLHCTLPPSRQSLGGRRPSRVGALLIVSIALPLIACLGRLSLWSYSSLLTHTLDCLLQPVDTLRQALGKRGGEEGGGGGALSGNMRNVLGMVFGK